MMVVGLIASSMTNPNSSEIWSSLLSLIVGKISDMIHGVSHSKLKVHLTDSLTFSYFSVWLMISSVSALAIFSSMLPINSWDDHSFTKMLESCSPRLSFWFSSWISLFTLSSSSYSIVLTGWDFSSLLIYSWCSLLSCVSSSSFFSFFSFLSFLSFFSLFSFFSFFSFFSLSSFSSLSFFSTFSSLTSFSLFV